MSVRNERSFGGFIIVLLNLTIPCRGEYHLHHLLLDFNGTQAFNGVLLEGILERLSAISNLLHVYVITSDTFGSVGEQMADLPVTIKRLSSSDHKQEKADFVESLGAESVIAIGNGSNDAAMLHAAAIGIAVIQQEGTSAATIQSADMVFTRITDALGGILNPQRMIATLRE